MIQPVAVYVNLKIQFILYYLSGLTLIIVISFLCISKLFWEIRLLKTYIEFILKNPPEKHWDSSK